MNRIRKVGNTYQVLITPDFKVSPDSAVLVGNWEDESLRNFYILEFDTLNDAQCEALKYPDVDWYRLMLNHEYIFKRLEQTLRYIISEHNLHVEFRANMMDPETMKNTFMDRVMNNGERFNLRHSMNDIITFTIVNPWTTNVHYISRQIENYRAHVNRDDLRLRRKKVIDGKIVCLYGITEFGTVYEIRILPTILDQWAQWRNNNLGKNEKHAVDMYKKYLKLQNKIDSERTVR